ncbi:MAG: hypothetical protein AB7J13_11550, partial [Pyrinomonadaceae bacterium]
LGRYPTGTIRMLFVFALFLTGVWSCEVGVDEAVTEEEVAVYRTVIRPGQGQDVFVSNGPMTALGITRHSDFGDVLPSLSKELATDFLARNQEPLNLADDVIIGEMRLLGAKNREERVADLNQFHSVSRVGFDATAKHALVHYFFFCGALCGKGAFYLLEKRDGVWVIVSKAETLII